VAPSTRSVCESGKPITCGKCYEQLLAVQQMIACFNNPFLCGGPEHVCGKECQSFGPRVLFSKLRDVVSWGGSLFLIEFFRTLRGK